MSKLSPTLYMLLPPPTHLRFSYSYYTIRELLNFNYLTRVSLRSNFSRINVIKADSVMSRKKREERKRKKSTFTSYFVFCLCSFYIFFFYSFFPFSFLYSLLFVSLPFFFFFVVLRENDSTGKRICHREFACVRAHL